MSDSAQMHPSVGEALAPLLRRPHLFFTAQWNWKSALLSAMIRGLIFLIATVRRGAAEIGVAVLVEALFSAAAAGVWGGVTQALRHAWPRWLARLIFIVLLPAAMLTLDAAAHYASGMRRMGLSLIMAAVFSMFSSMFNLHIMRRGALLIGAEGDTLGRDMARMPGLIAEFVSLLARGGFRFASRCMPGGR